MADKAMIQSNRVLDHMIRYGESCRVKRYSVRGRS